MMNWRVIYSRSGVSNQLISLPGSAKFSHFCQGFHSIDLVLPIFWIPTNRKAGWHKFQRRDAPGLCYGRCCCEAEVLTGDMRPRETMGNMGREWRGETVFMTPDPVQCSAALSPHYTVHTLHSTPGGCSWQQTSVWSVYTNRVPGLHCYTLHSFIGIYNFTLTLVFSHVWWHWHALNIVFVCHFIVFYCRGANSH